MNIIAIQQRPEIKKETLNIENTCVYSGARINILSNCGEYFDSLKIYPLPLNQALVMYEFSDIPDLLILGLPVKELYVYETSLAYFELKAYKKVYSYLPDDEMYQSIKIES